MARRIRPYRPAGLVLFHGAGGDRNHRLFVRLEDELALPVARVDFPYRRKGPGRRPPDRMPKLIEAVDEAVAASAETWGVSPKRLVVGGRSLGGRAASLAMAGVLWIDSGWGCVLLFQMPLSPSTTRSGARTPPWLRVLQYGGACMANMMDGAVSARRRELKSMYWVSAMLNLVPWLAAKPNFAVNGRFSTKQRSGNRSYWLPERSECPTVQHISMPVRRCVDFIPIVRHCARAA